MILADEIESLLASREPSIASLVDGLAWFRQDVTAESSVGKTDSHGAMQAITFIRVQGEGSTDTPEDTGLDDLAHYYRFEEVFVGKRLQQDSETGEYFHGEPIEFPAVWPMKPVPSNGYRKGEVPEDVNDLLEELDRTYSKVLDSLQDAWGDEGRSSYRQAVNAMLDMESVARSLMQIPISDHSHETFGPCFRYLP